MATWLLTYNNAIIIQKKKKWCEKWSEGSSQSTLEKLRGKIWKLFSQKKRNREEIYWLGQKQAECVAFKHLCAAGTVPPLGLREIETYLHCHTLEGHTGLHPAASTRVSWGSLGPLGCVHSEPVRHLPDHGTGSCALEFNTQMAPSLCPQPAGSSLGWLIPLLRVPLSSSVGQGEVFCGDFGQSINSGWGAQPCSEGLNQG